MNNMVRKLSSRKLWAAIAGVTAGIALIVNGNVTEGTTTIISSVVAYMLAEGIIDAASAKNASVIAEGAAAVAETVADAVKKETDDKDCK